MCSSIYSSPVKKNIMDNVKNSLGFMVFIGISTCICKKKKTSFGMNHTDVGMHFLRLSFIATGCSDFGGGCWTCRLLQSCLQNTYNIQVLWSRNAKPYGYFLKEPIWYKGRIVYLSVVGKLPDDAGNMAPVDPGWKNCGYATMHFSIVTKSQGSNSNKNWLLCIV